MAADTQRQCRTSIRKSHAALKFPPDAIDFRDRQRADLLPGSHGEKPEARLDRVGSDGHPVSRRRAVVLVGGSHRQSHSSTSRRRRSGRQHGGQRGPFRHLQLRTVRHGHNGRLVWCGQLDA